MRIIELGDGVARAVRASGRLDAPPEPALLHLVELTTSLLNVPAAQVLLFGPERSFVAAATGPDLAGDARLPPVPRDRPVLVADTDDDPLRAWAGAPLRSPEGNVLGSLYALDDQPHEWTEPDEHVLAALAHAVSAEIARLAFSRREIDAAARADFQATLLRATNEATLDGVLVVSPEGRILSWNTRFQRIWAIDEEALGSGSDDVALASVLRKVADPERFVTRVRDLYAEPRIARDEIAMLDGRLLDRYGTPLYGDDGTYHGYAWFMRDVSAERAAQHAVKASEARYRTLVQALTNEVWRASPTGDLVGDMPTWRAVTGQTEAELLGRGWLMGVHPDDRRRVRAAWQQAVAGLTEFEEECRIRPVAGSGPTRILQMHSVPLVTDGAVTEWIGVHVDVTEVRASEEAERREAARAALATDSTRVLQAITAALSRAVSTDDVMGVILARGQAVLGASGCGVAIRHGDKVRYELLTGYSADVKSSWSEFDMDDDTPVTRVIRTGEPCFISTQQEFLDAFPDSQALRKFVTTSGEQALARLPLATPSGVLGVLSFGFDEPRPFPPEERQFLIALAGQCAQALERARLYERERGTARMLQHSLLPEALPLVLGMRLAAVCETRTPDMDVGGDWYDAVILDDGRLAIAVGDVRGRGVRAASVMGQVRNALRGLVHADPSPTTMLCWLDKVVSRLGDDEEFVTLLYAVACPATGTLEWANAGHMPPLVVAADGARFVEGAESLPLGLGGSRPTARLTLAPGDALVLFSDGLVENRRRPLGQGLQQLLDLASTLTPDAPGAEALRDLLTSSMVDERDTDDVTVLTLRRANEAHGVGREPLVAQIDLPARPTSPARARDFVGARLGEWGAMGVLEQTMLCVSELVTNAVVHAGARVHLELRCGEGVLRVDVRDTGRAVLPSVRAAAGMDDTHGRGLFLVEILCDRWGVIEEGDGKVVWFELEVPDRA